MNSNKFEVTREVYDRVKRNPASATAMAFAYGVPTQDFEAAYAEYAATESGRIAQEEVDNRIKVKTDRFTAFSKTLTAFTPSESLISILNEGRTLSASLSDKDGNFPINISFSYDEKNNRWNLTASGENREVKVAGSKGRVTYDYFFSGQAIEGRLSDWVKSNHPTSASAKAIDKGVNAWTAVQVDAQLSNLITRSARS